MSDLISLSSLGKELCGFIINSSTDAKYSFNNGYTKYSVDDDADLAHTPIARGYYIPVPRAWVLGAYALADHEDPSSLLSSEKLLEYDASLIKKFLSRSSNLSEVFDTIPNFMRSRHHNFYAKGWIPLLSKRDSYIPSNEAGILVYNV